VKRKGRRLTFKNSLPSADRLAKKTGATIVGNGEVIHVMRAAGVPETQLIAVAGGERIPLFSKAQKQAVAGLSTTPAKPKGPVSGPPGPPTPNPDDAIITVHAWPSLHALMPPGDHNSLPETIDSGTVYTGSGSHQCTLDITRGLTYGLGSLFTLDPLPPGMPEEMKIFVQYMRDRDANRYSFFDGGQMMYNFVIDGKALLWNGHLGGYEGILESLKPKPDVAILAIAGRANLNGRPFDGSAADFAVQEVQWIGEPAKVIWCLHDRGAINPKFINVKAATERVEKETKSSVIDLKPAELYKL
jgi:hypothetical protein